MPRYRLIVEYDGSGLVGWQKQDNGPSVQALLEAAAERLAGHAVSVVGGGRTDAGVHASGQAAHLDLAKDLCADRVRDGLNFWLRQGSPAAPVSVLSAARAVDGFHARFSAIGRRYRYRIINRRAPLALDLGRAWWVQRPLDAQAMHDAAQLLVGHHDFSTFRAAECQASSPMKTLDRLEVRRVGAEIEIITAARSFLHHQVRNMAGSLKLVGEGKWRADDLAAAFLARDRRQGGATAPAAGLTLVEIVYPPDLLADVLDQLR